MNLLRKYGGLSALLILLLTLSGCPSPSDSGNGGEPLVLDGTVHINGSASLNGTLTADIADLEGTGDVSYQWIRDDAAPITGAVSETYAPAAADFGKLLKVRVSRAGYTGTVESDQVGPVSAANDNMTWALNETTRYFSLSQGIELPALKSSTAEWDIAVKAEGGFCYILTNSGATAAALGSGGDGGVWFTDKTNFDSVTFADRVTDFSGTNAEYEVYTKDVIRYQAGMYALLGDSMNIMTYFGYESGDGSEGSPFDLSTDAPFIHPFFEFDKKAYTYAGTTMPPTWYPTKQVYIIRHADGASYSKFQVSAVRYERGFTFIVGFKFKNLGGGISGPFNPGAYTGQAAGYGGTLNLSTTFSEDAITNIVIDAHSETTTRPGVQQALADIPPAIIAAQRLDVDGVSGATRTTNAIKNAVEACVVKAGGNPSAFKGP
jgi:hypothetical protein